MLPVHAEACKLWFCDDGAILSICEPEQAPLFFVGIK